MDRNLVNKKNKLKTHISQNSYLSYHDFKL